MISVFFFLPVDKPADRRSAQDGGSSRGRWQDDQPAGPVRARPQVQKTSLYLHSQSTDATCHRHSELLVIPFLFMNPEFILWRWTLTAKSQTV